jgi:hypothetical protein
MPHPTHDNYNEEGNTANHSDDDTYDHARVVAFGGGTLVRGAWSGHGNYVNFVKTIKQRRKRCNPLNHTDIR